MSKPQREFKGIWIPASIFLREDLTWTEKVVLTKIDSLDRHSQDGVERPGCFASNSYLAEFVGVSPRMIQIILSKLVESGLMARMVDVKTSKRTLLSMILSQENQPKSDGPVGRSRVRGEGRSRVRMRHELYFVGEPVSNVTNPPGTIDDSTIGKAPMNKESNKDPDPEHIFSNFSASQLSHLLVKILNRTLNTFMSPTRFKSWEKSIQSLLDRGVPSQEVRNTILWYGDNWRVGGVPVIAHAAGLVMKYDHLKMLMAKAQAPVVLVPRRTGTKYEKEMKIELFRQFDREQEGHGRKCAQALSKPLAKWFVSEKEAATNLHEEAKGLSDLSLVSERFLFDLLPSVPVFVDHFRGWVMSVINSWPNWNGQYEVFRPQGKMWYQFLRWWKDPFGYSDEAWDKYDRERRG